ncbi:MAG: hypothetical protein PHI27_07315 [Eubacteriales bacterium]|nr:hypothetical protein [Eubacteriales bacterium]MDD3882045.1 hypothetical protein [Eubacteriales bacterium]MDD4512492.1 hypothetical protein [Eubacteriales bacterium]
MYLYHYFDKETGPFRNLSDLAPDEALRLLETIKLRKPSSKCAQRNDEYIENRRRCESILREKFAEKSGRIERLAPHYMVVGHSLWLSSWYSDSDFVKIPISEFDTRTLSFTYGDSMPTFSPKVNDGKEYRRQLYTYPEILEIIEKYGLPQVWNDDGRFGPERYIEVHVWSDETVSRYRQEKQKKSKLG